MEINISVQTTTFTLLKFCFSQAFRKDYHCPWKKTLSGPLGTRSEVAVASARGEQLEQAVRWMGYVFGDFVTTFQDPLIVYVTQCGELGPNYFGSIFDYTL